MKTREEIQNKINKCYLSRRQRKDDGLSCDYIDGYIAGLEYCIKIGVYP